jgi:hypothetical protein
MTEQPVETEQEFLGNAPRQAYLPNGHRLPMPPFSSLSLLDASEAAREELEAATAPLPAGARLAPRDRMLLEAEQHAINGTHSLSSGELDEGIAWLQSALAFALNYRHAVRFEVSGE